MRVGGQRFGDRWFSLRLLSRFNQHTTEQFKCAGFSIVGLCGICRHADCWHGARLADSQRRSALGIEETTRCGDCVRSAVCIVKRDNLRLAGKDLSGTCGALYSLIDG